MGLAEPSGTSSQNTYPHTQLSCSPNSHAHTHAHVYTHIHVHTVTEAKSHGCHSLPQRCFTKGLRRPVLRRGTPFPGDPELDGDLHRPSLTTLLNSFFFFLKKGMFGNQRSYLKFYTSRRAGLPFYVFYTSVFEKYSLSKDILP